VIAKTHPVAVRLEGAAFETLKYLSATTRQPYAGVECVWLRFPNWGKTAGAEFFR